MRLHAKCPGAGPTSEPTPEAQAAKAQAQPANAYRNGSVRLCLKGPRTVSSPKRSVALTVQPWKASGAHQGHSNAAGAQRGGSHAPSKTSQTCAAGQATQDAINTAPGAAHASGRSEPELPGLPAPGPRSMSLQGTSPAAAASPQQSVSSSANSSNQPQTVKPPPQAQPVALPDSCPQAPGQAKPLPAADAPVESPKPQPGGSQAGSPGHRRTLSRAAAHQPRPLGAPGVLFVLPAPEMPAVQGIAAAEKAEKASAGDSVAAQMANGAPQHVSLHAYAAGARSTAGNAAETGSAQDAAAVEAGAARKQALEPQKACSQPAALQQPGAPQKRGPDDTSQPSQRRKRSLPGLLGALCNCFAPAPSASPPEPAADEVSLESRCKV